MKGLAEKLQTELQIIFDIISKLKILKEVKHEIKYLKSKFT